MRKLNRVNRNNVMCLSVLILSTKEASVVDLPEPVGPVIKTRPLGYSANLLTMGGIPTRQYRQFHLGLTSVQLLGYHVHEMRLRKRPKSPKAKLNRIPCLSSKLVAALRQV